MQQMNRGRSTPSNNERDSCNCSGAIAKMSNNRIEMAAAMPFDLCCRLSYVIVTVGTPEIIAINHHHSLFFPKRAFSF
jgi:hypothetical protein